MNLNPKQIAYAKRELLSAFGPLSASRMDYLLKCVRDSYEMALDDEPNTSKVMNFRFAVAINTDWEFVKAMKAEWEVAQ